MELIEKINRVDDLLAKATMLGKMEWDTASYIFKLGVATDKIQYDEFKLLIHHNEYLRDFILAYLPMTEDYKEVEYLRQLMKMVKKRGYIRFSTIGNAVLEFAPVIDSDYEKYKNPKLTLLGAIRRGIQTIKKS